MDIQLKYNHIYGAPPLWDAQQIKQLLQNSHGKNLCILRDDVRITQFSEYCQFIMPNMRIINFPAWDCLPFDRISPDNLIIAQRVSALYELLNSQNDKPCLIITSFHAVMQRVLPKHIIQNQGCFLAKKQKISMEQLSAKLVAMGYVHSEVVRESGEFVRRGGLLDVFPSGFENPIRLDFLGNEIEKIMIFNAENQRRSTELDEIHIAPFGEVPLDADSVANFRNNYRNLFGTNALKDLILEQINMGYRPAGIEHFQPLFFDKMPSLLDYALENSSKIFMDENFSQAIKARHELIQDYYQSRVAFCAEYETQLKKSLANKKAEENLGNPYRPVPINNLYLDEQEFQNLCANNEIFQIHDKEYDGESRQKISNIIDGKAIFGRDFASERANQAVPLFESLAMRITESSKPILITSKSLGGLDRISNYLASLNFQSQIIKNISQIKNKGENFYYSAVLPIDRGFVAPQFTCITDADIFGEALVGRTKKRKKAENFIREIQNLNIGDFVVHIDHGIGRFLGLETIKVDDAQKECLVLEYAKSKLFVPVENMDLLSRFGNSDVAVELDVMGLGNWQLRMARTKKRLKDMADKLIAIAAARAVNQAPKITIDSMAYSEFVARFPFVETEDQLSAINDVIADFEGNEPMERLICGDVGFGKTEVAMRAAFLAVYSGYQVCIICPTTLLARQHHRNFLQRFQNMAVKIRALSRLTAPKDAKIIKQELSEGKVDIVIGTHSLLAKSISVKKLGLIIVDEEQHFGVAQKEHIKDIGKSAHVLTLSATPIPRTMQMALGGVRQLSIIATPPIDRLAVRSFAGPFDPLTIKEAIDRELFRGGQIFAVTPKIHRLDAIQDSLRAIYPNLRMIVAHGQMSGTELENAMQDFADGKYDILLSTNIIESGIDMPNVNTMLIFNAQLFGLAQLYQLRGRVGRAKQRGYCYFTYPEYLKLSDKSLKRLEVIKTLDHLGAGFSLASHDLDMRGAGNLLGEEQSGHILEVGVELYQQMLNEAIIKAKTDYRKQLNAQKSENAVIKSVKTQNELNYQISPQLSLGVSVVIPEFYIKDFTTRMAVYSRLSEFESEHELSQYAAECADRFGAPPKEFYDLLTIMAIKQFCRVANIAKIQAGPRGAVVQFYQNNFANPQELLQFINEQNGLITMKPDHSLVVVRNWQDNAKKLQGVRNLSAKLAQLAKKV